jgi:hypothetical protein
VIKNNLDPTRCGRLQVFIPELGGNPDDQANWRTVSHASPFMGYTSNKFEQSDVPSKADTYNTVAHTYGMWMVPPDLGVEVIVLFVAGDPQRGYWLACVNSNLSHYMVPGLAGSRNVDLNQSSDSTKKSFIGGNPMPVVEFNEYNPTNINQEFYRNAKPVHEAQFNILKQQGLDRDPVRGAISSSSQRESPSYVFGISTPGPLDTSPGAKKGKIGYDGASNANAPVSRLGGSTFVMDDGDRYGQNELVRIRTRTGHQILLHNSQDLIYIANSKGTAWIELTSNGKIDIFAADSVSIHTETDLNIRADRDINLEAGRNINMRTESGKWHAEIATDLEFLVNANTNITVGADYNLLVGADTKISSYKDFNLATNGSNNFTAGADTNISTTGNHVETAASINMNDTLTAAAADVATFVKPFELRENLIVSTTAGWDKLYQAGKLNSIMKRIPMHEPWPQHENLAPDQQRPANTDRET